MLWCRYLTRYCREPAVVNKGSLELGRTDRTDIFLHPVEKR